MAIHVKGHRRGKAVVKAYTKKTRATHSFLRQRKVLTKAFDSIKPTDDRAIRALGMAIDSVNKAIKVKRDKGAHLSLRRRLRRFSRYI